MKQKEIIEKMKAGAALIVRISYQYPKCTLYLEDSTIKDVPSRFRYKLRLNQFDSLLEKNIIKCEPTYVSRYYLDGFGLAEVVEEYELNNALKD